MLDGIFVVMNFMYIYYGEIMFQVVIIEVIVKWIFWFFFFFMNGVGNDEISVVGKEVVVFKQVVEVVFFQQVSKSKFI